MVKRIFFFRFSPGFTDFLPVDQFKSLADGELPIVLKMSTRLPSRDG